jgi:hypothetical protein
MSNQEKATFFERLRKGLGESIAYSRAELSLKTTIVPAPHPKVRRPGGRRTPQAASDVASGGPPQGTTRNNG